MEEGRSTTSERRADSRGVHHGLAAVIALTLALAAALQAGFAKLATQSAIAAVIAGADAQGVGEVAATKSGVAAHTNTFVARIAVANKVELGAMGGQVESVEDRFAACKAGLGSIPPPVM